MVDRIDLILKAKNITARQFADEIGVQPSGMSHILSGRNNPSLDFVMKVMRRYPDININWLMFGKGEMFADPSSLQSMRPEPRPVAPKPVEPDLFSQPEPEPPTPVDAFVPQPDPEPVALPEPESPTKPEPHQEPPQPQLDENRLYDSAPAPVPVQANPAQRRLVKVVLLYSDRTCEEYTPRG